MWHKNGVSPQFKARRLRPPLDEAALKELAIRYVGKYATTRAKLCVYLARKIHERGWRGDKPADLEALANRFAELGYVDDSAFAMSRSHALAARGYGKRRLTEQLRLAGVCDEDGRDAIESADTNAVTAALRFARRRRFGPFAVEPADRLAREKAMAAMVRAGHDFSLARKIVLMKPGELVDLPNLCESSQVDPA